MDEDGAEIHVRTLNHHLDYLNGFEDATFQLQQKIHARSDQKHLQDDMDDCFINLPGRTNNVQDGCLLNKGCRVSHLMAPTACIFNSSSLRMLPHQNAENMEEERTKD